MVQNVNPTFPKTPNRGIATFSTGTGTTALTVYTGSANGSKVYGLNLTSATSAIIRYQIVNSGSNYVLNTQAITANSGFDGSTPPVNLLAPTIVPGLPIDSDGNVYLILASTADTLTANTLTTLPAGGGINIVATVADF